MSGGERAERLRCFAVAAPGLSDLVAAELEGLGIGRRRLRIDAAGVEWEGDAASLAAANLWLRTASRVVVRAAEFPAQAFHELERRGRKVPWERWIAPGSAVDVRVTSRKSRLYHSDAVAERIHEAIAHRVGEVGASVAADDDEGEGEWAQLVVVRVAHDQVTVSIDSSGALLHRRGYRQAVAKAPLRETIAAAMLMASGWRGDAPLQDPLCGAGTIPIEGAMMARRIAPGLARGEAGGFAFLRWPELAGGAAWMRALDEARSAALPRAPQPIVGSDRDAGAIVASRANAERAGVAHDVAFEVSALSAIEPPDGPGWLVTNPPYGIRVGEAGRVRDLWAQFGKVARDRLGGWTVVLLSPDAALERQVGIPLEPRLRTSNGGIPVRVAVGRVPE